MAREGLAQYDNHKEFNTEKTQWFIPWFGQVQNLPTPRCGVPMDESCTQLLSSDPMINLNTTVLCFSFLIAFVRNLHNLESLALTIRLDIKHKSKGGKQHTQIHSKYAHTHGQDLSSNEYIKVLTRTELKSLRMSNECARTKCE